MTAKPLLRRTAALILALALLLMLLPITAQAADAKPLSEHQIGTVFKLSEDGTLYDWILISHNYEGTGNQLLMRKDTIQYDNLPNFIEGYIYDGEMYDRFNVTDFCNSAISTYLNSDYLSKFTTSIQNTIVQTNIPVITGVCGYNNAKGSPTVTSVGKSPFKIFILSEKEIGLTPRALYYVSGLYEGTTIDYFKSNTQRASNTAYILRGTNCGSPLKSNIYLISTEGSMTYKSRTSTPHYYRPCLVLPASTTATANAEIIGMIIPTISSVTVPTVWAQSNSITINATNATNYAVTTTNKAPASGWQTSKSFKLTANGTYYAWVKSATGHTASKAFTVSKVDTTAPVISAVAVPDEWATSGSIRITATDSQSGVSAYLVTDSNSTPSASAAWQSSPEFTFTANGYYYAWAKDSAGNISAQYGFRLDKIDTDKPVISEISYPDDWTNNAELTITAADATSSLVYAVSSSYTEPTEGWQEQPKLQFNSNGGFYAWVKDQAGNSAYKYFYFSKYDGVAPTISSVTVPDEWATSSSIKISASDSSSGISGYAVTSENTAPTDSAAWQTSPQFTLSENGSYFAWAKDKAGNTVSMEFAIDKIDTIAPVVSAVAVPDVWTASGIIRITADDYESGIAGYLFTSENAAPAHDAPWQPTPELEISENGYFYAWVKDNAGNISECYGFRTDKVDTDKPVISEISYPDDWTNSAELTITAADATSSLVYAVSSSLTEPAEGWQEQAKFPLTSNGGFYAWAKDQAGNSAYKYFYFSKYDGTAPEISNVHFNTNNTVMTVSANDYASGVKAIIIDAVEHEGGYTQYQIPAGTRYITIQAKDKAGNISEERKVRVPGWYDTLGSLAITSVEFDADITTATIKAETTDTAIKGIYVNDKLYAANPVVYALGTTTKYLVMQVEDVNGDRSALYKVRVPGWTAESPALEITSCVFSEDNSYATITATENPEKEEDRRGITGIKVNGEFIEGNPVAYPIPEGTRHLEMIAYNTDGDYSPTLIRRVPGWSEVVSTLSIINCEFSDYNKRATVTALATGGDSVAGIFVNGEFFEGNPIVYDIDKDTDVLHLQAANFNGDLSAMVNRDVPRDTSKATLKLTITPPGWTSAARAKVKITATDKYDIRELLAKAGEDSEWEDITDTRYIYITEDTTVWASAENDEGAIKEAYLDIVCFDRNAPTVTAAQQDKVVNIRAEDDKSGIKAIYVNNVEYSGSQIYGGNLRYTIPEGVTTVTVKAVDEAGNESQMVELGVKATVTAIPMMIAPSAAPTPEPEPPAAVIPEPEPEPEVEAKPEPEPIPEPEPQEQPEAAGMTTAQMAAIAGGVFAASSAATGATIWWLMRKRRMNQVVPELDYKGYRLKYDESDYGGSVDPLDKSNVTEVVFNRKIS